MDANACAPPVVGDSASDVEGSVRVAADHAGGDRRQRLPAEPPVGDGAGGVQSLFGDGCMGEGGGDGRRRLSADPIVNDGADNLEGLVGDRRISHGGGDRRQRMRTGRVVGDGAGDGEARSGSLPARAVAIDGNTSPRTGR